MACESEATLHEFHRRGTHKVPLPVLLAMREKWERDADAIHIAPAGLMPTEQPSAAATSGSANRSAAATSRSATAHASSGAASSTEPLTRWLSRHQCYHYSHSRPKTHLQMAVGDQSATFLNIPRAARLGIEPD